MKSTQFDLSFLIERKLICFFVRFSILGIESFVPLNYDLFQDNKTRLQCFDDDVLDEFMYTRIVNYAKLSHTEFPFSPWA